MPPIDERNGNEGTTRAPVGTTTSGAADASVRKPLTKRLAALVAVPLLVVALAACQGNTGISSEDAAAIKDQIEQVAARLDAVEDRLIDLSQSNEDAPAMLISEVRAATSDVGAAKTMLADVSSQLEASVPDTTVEDAIDQTDDFFNQPLPNLDGDNVDPFLDQAPPIDQTPNLDIGPDSPFGDDQP